MKLLTMEHIAQGIKDRHVGAMRARLVEKWSRTGLLRGLDGHKRETMAQLLENQAAQVLKETANSISTGGGSLATSGQIQGFTNIAFPIVRRVFGGLVANELVSIQPMSLPSGLIFYLDYTYGSNVGGNAGLSLSSTATESTYTQGQSIYNNPTGKGVQSGSLATGGLYDLVNIGYTKVQSGSGALTGSYNSSFGAWNNTNGSWQVANYTGTQGYVSAMSGVNGALCNFDPDVDVNFQNGTIVSAVFFYANVSDLLTALPAGDFTAVEQIALFAFPNAGGTTAWTQTFQSGTGVLNLRRLNKRGNLNGSTGAWTSFTPAPLNGAQIQFFLQLSAVGNPPAFLSGTTTGNNGGATFSMALADSLSVETDDGATVTIPSFESNFASTPSPAIPEIDIKIESIAITATTRKLRARWSPELAQDLNAYHSMDAEVELTSILSEQIALEIDREILNDLVTQANGANMYWSRAPGKFVNKLTGVPIVLNTSLSIGPAFTGTVREWYETLTETIIDCANTIHRKTLRGSANFLVAGPDIATIFEASILYKPKFSVDGEGQVGSPFTIGCENIGTLSNRFTVYKDPYFPRSRILVGYKGGSYLETGYVYSPYVPLIVTPTIFAPEDFTPRKGVMTRYGKKVVRSDFYGTVTVLDMNII